MTPSSYRPRKPTRLEVEQAIGLYWPETERWPNMTQQQMTPAGNMITVPENADPYAAYQAAYLADAGEELPTPTDTTDSLAGTVDNPGQWFRVTKLWGPKDLGNGPVMCAELVDSDGVVARLFFGGLIEPKLEQARAGIEAGLNFWFRYVQHPKTAKSKGPFYTGEGKFAPEQPEE